MHEENLFIKDGIIYDNTYGCNKQYRYANELWILSLLQFTYIVIINIHALIILDMGEAKYMVSMDLTSNT